MNEQRYIGYKPIIITMIISAIISLSMLLILNNMIIAEANHILMILIISVAFFSFVIFVLSIEFIIGKIRHDCKNKKSIIED